MPEGIKKKKSNGVEKETANYPLGVGEVKKWPRKVSRFDNSSEG